MFRCPSLLPVGAHHFLMGGAWGLQSGEEVPQPLAVQAILLSRPESVQTPLTSGLPRVGSGKLASG